VELMTNGVDFKLNKKFVVISGILLTEQSQLHAIREYLPSEFEMCILRLKSIFFSLPNKS